MRINAIVEGTNVNGPGYRFGLWVQGCKRNCSGCFNKEACRMDGGSEMSVSEILAVIKRKKYDGVSVSGGEPFYQSRELGRLLKEVRKLGMNTLVFSGFTYEELKARKEKALRYCDYLIDGPYMRHLPSHNKWAGSGNQRVLLLKDGEVEKDVTNETEGERQSEIFINEDGDIVSTGFINIMEEEV